MSELKPCPRCVPSPATIEQPSPADVPGKDIADLVVEDIRARKALGIARYGKPLRANNGRDPLVDAYQEALDLCVYLRQEIAERDAGARLLDAIVDRCARAAPSGLDPNVLRDALFAAGLYDTVRARIAARLTDCAGEDHSVTAPHDCDDGGR